MPSLNEILTFEYESEYDTEYDLSLKKLYSAPKIYTANGDLKKRWYVYFSYRNPKTGKLERLNPIYGKANTFHTKENRLTVLTAYRKKLIHLLKEGFNPFEDNTTLYKERNKVANPSQADSIISETNSPTQQEVKQPKTTIKEAFDFALKIKENLVNSTTIIGYRNKVNNFLKWLAKNHKEVAFIEDLTKKIISEFLNSVLVKTSARNRNNFRVDLSSLMQTMEDNELIAVNFIKKIPVLKSIPQRNKTYTQEKQEEIFTYLETKDPILLLFIKFISYNLLRPIEVCRLKVGDLNLKNRTIQFKAKNSPLKTKIIPEILINDLPDISKLQKDLLLFTPEKIGGKWDTKINNRRDYFTKRFKKIVKKQFSLSSDYGLYSFRHTYITKLYRELVKNSSPFEAKSKLMLITGHSTMTALEKYLRDIDAELPADYSELLK